MPSGPAGLALVGHWWGWHSALWAGPGLSARCTVILGFASVAWGLLPARGGPGCCSPVLTGGSSQLGHIPHLRALPRGAWGSACPGLAPCSPIFSDIP